MGSPAAKSAAPFPPKRRSDIEDPGRPAQLLPPAYGSREARELFVNALGLPLEAGEDDDYFHSERIDGSKHFGVWPLSQAAQACFHASEAGARWRSCW